MCCPISFSRALSRPEGDFRNLLTSSWPLPPFGAVGFAIAASSVAVHVGTADGVLRARERHLGKRGGFHGERREIFRLQRMDVGLAAGAGHHLSFDREA